MIIVLIKRGWAIFASTGLTIILAFLICLNTAWGSILVVGNQRFYQEMDTVVLFPWLYKEGTSSLDLTLWVYILIILMTFFAVNTVVCTTDKVYAILKGRKPFKALFPHIVHVGFFIALLGHLLGSVAGFRSSGNVLMQGEVTAVPHTSGLMMRLDEARMDIDERGRPSFIQTRVALLRDGTQVKVKDISLNEPLIYKGIAFYHANSGETTTGFLLDVGGSIRSVPFEGFFEVPGGERIKLGRIFPDFVMDMEGRPRTRSTEYRNPVQELIDEYGKSFYLNISRQGGWVVIDGTKVIVKDYARTKYAVLTINKDPGIWLIGLGSLILVIGMVLLLLFRHAAARVGGEGKGGCCPGSLNNSGSITSR